MSVQLMQYTINGIFHQIIIDEGDNVMLEVRHVAGYDVDIDELIGVLRHDQQGFQIRRRNEDSN